MLSPCYHSEGYAVEKKEKNRTLEVISNENWEQKKKVNRSLE